MVFLTLKLHGGHFFFFLNFVFSLRTVFNKAMSVLTGIRIVILTELRKTVDSLFLVCHCGRKVCICHLYVNLGENVCVYCNVCLTNILSSPVLPASKQNWTLQCIVSFFFFSPFFFPAHIFLFIFIFFSLFFSTYTVQVEMVLMFSISFLFNWLCQVGKLICLILHHCLLDFVDVQWTKRVGACLKLSWWRWTWRKLRRQKEVTLKKKRY